MNNQIPHKPPTYQYHGVLTASSPLPSGDRVGARRRWRRRGGTEPRLPKHDMVWRRRGPVPVRLGPGVRNPHRLPSPLQQDRGRRHQAVSGYPGGVQDLREGEQGLAQEYLHRLPAVLQHIHDEYDIHRRVDKHYRHALRGIGGR